MTPQTAPYFPENLVGITVLGSGSGGNCTLLHHGRDAIMIDAGFSARETAARMLQAGVAGLHVLAILVTHEHADHVKGLRVCASKLNAPIFATAKCADFLRTKDSRLPRFSTFAPGGRFAVGEFTVCPFSISHDAEDPVAFTIQCQHKRIAVATDIGYISASVEYGLRSCNALVLESNHDLNMLAKSDRPWSLKQRIMGMQGHLSNDSVEQLLRKVLAPETENLILAHISRECNTPDCVKDNALKCLHELRRDDIRLDIASQDNPLKVWLSI
jgi:phosphoribosyl 1,2-cyclic phosphodiesterase